MGLSFWCSEVTLFIIIWFIIIFKWPCQMLILIIPKLSRQVKSITGIGKSYVAFFLQENCPVRQHYHNQIYWVWAWKWEVWHGFDVETHQSWSRRVCALTSNPCREAYHPWTIPQRLAWWDQTAPYSQNEPRLLWQVTGAWGLEPCELVLSLSEVEEDYIQKHMNCDI